MLLNQCLLLFGFLHSRSSLQQLLILFNNVVNSLQKGHQTDVAYLDFSKAFDSVAHNELLYKLWSFGITGKLWMWIHAYTPVKSTTVYEIETGLNLLQTATIIVTFSCSI